MTIASGAASLVTSQQSPLLTNVLGIARGGAIAASATAASSALWDAVKNNDEKRNEINDLRAALIRGGATTRSRNTMNKEALGNPETTKTFGKLTPKGSSVLCMAIAMSLHYLSYSIARPSTIALFTSAKTGFAGNTAAFPLAMAFISPTSLMLLFIYGKILGKAGPRGAVRQTTFLCASVLWVASLLVFILQGINPITIPLFAGKSIQMIQALVGALFIFRESYVQLLTSQYWSFMASILTPDQSAKWFSPISGLTSVTSAVSGFGVSSLVEKVGLPGALATAGCILITSLFFTERAYSISDEGGFTPEDDKMKKSGRGLKEPSDSAHDQSLIKKASALFGRVPVLKSLFMEILAGQGLATLLNVCFVTKLSESIPDDTMRAGWMGKFFASINVVAMCLQFGVIPKVMPHLEPRTLWRFMPITMVAALGYLCSNGDPSLHLISGAFMLFKVMEFSIRRMLDEMVYVPLDFESRFLGKEIISVFGYRFGKSGMSLALSGLTSMFGDFGLQQLSCLTWGASCLWLSAAWNVSNRVLTRAVAEEAYQAKMTMKKKRTKSFEQSTNLRDPSRMAEPSTLVGERDEDDCKPLQNRLLSQLETLQSEVLELSLQFRNKPTGEVDEGLHRLGEESTRQCQNETMERVRETQVAVDRLQDCVSREEMRFDLRRCLDPPAIQQQLPKKEISLTMKEFSSLIRDLGQTRLERDYYILQLKEEKRKFSGLSTKFAALFEAMEKSNQLLRKTLNSKEDVCRQQCELIRHLQELNFPSKYETIKMDTDRKQVDSNDSTKKRATTIRKHTRNRGSKKPRSPARSRQTIFT